MFCKSFWAIVLSFSTSLQICFASTPATLKLYSFRGNVSIFNGYAYETLARGWKPQDPELSITVGKNSGLTFDGDNNETLSIIGPALLSWESDVGIKLEYGEILIRRPETQTLDGKSILAGEFNMTSSGFLEVLIEKSSQKGSIRIINLSSGTLNLGNHTLLKNQIFVGSINQPLISTLSENEKSTYRMRHFNNRHNRALSEQDSKKTTSETESGAKPNPRFFEAGFLPTISKLYPAEGSTFGQNLGGLGVFVKFGSQKFWTLPPDEAKRTRAHYMLAPSVRWGIGIQGLSLWMQTYPGFNIRNQSIAGQFFLGWGWQGLFVDALGGAVWDLNKKLNKPFAMKFPWNAGVDAGYRIDLLKYVDSDMGLLVGGRGIWNSMERNTEVGSTEGDLSSPQTFSLVSYSIFAALSLRF